jgi:hypothetical protein
LQGVYRADAGGEIPAHARLVGGLVSIVSHHFHYAEARKAVDRSLALDPNLAAAHRLLGALELNYNFDFEASQAEFKVERDAGTGCTINAAGSISAIGQRILDLDAFYETPAPSSSG